jgi:cytochrome c oxidase cbb3-type subunit 2
MPPYAFLAEKPLDYHNIDSKLRVLKTEGVPYTEDEITNAKADLEAQADPFSAGGPKLKARYGAKVNQRDFDGNPDKITEMDALIAYLQMLGTLVDFSKFHPEQGGNSR